MGRAVNLVMWCIVAVWVLWVGRWWVVGVASMLQRLSAWCTVWGGCPAWPAPQQPGSGHPVLATTPAQPQPQPAQLSTCSASER
jgi:hypothetical protein